MLDLLPGEWRMESGGFKNVPTAFLRRNASQTQTENTLLPVRFANLDSLIKGASGCHDIQIREHYKRL
jgi:hypothetical protein